MACAESESITVKRLLNSLEENLATACEQISGDTPTLDESRFNKDKFWKNFIGATKLISHEATKFCMIFSKPPLPSPEETEALCNKIENTFFNFVAVFCTLPRTRGRILRKEIRFYILSLLQGMKELCVAAKNNSSSQLLTVGNIWEKCEAADNLPKDNRDAVITLCRGELLAVQDACEELKDAMENEDESAEELFVPRVNGLNIPNSSWTDSDRQVLLPCSGLIRAAKACLKKTLFSISERSDGDNEGAINELDEVADIIKLSSSYIDDFVLSLYPPMNHSAVREEASHVRLHYKNLLSYVKNCHFCTNTDEEWISFLEKAVDHNWVKINDIVLAD